ncbi:MAG: response regulator, partial [Chitinivibrionales bacterium]|nr:response regulator [Chitinivibrionales bacterium]MBD3358496.1 response regulator [Chitinivibrionales bacterium]
MQSESLIIGMADDVKSLHTRIENILSKKFPSARILHFYDTQSVKSFLANNPYGLDILLLDIHFGAKEETGIEALPEIRNFAPGLPICLLTSEDDPAIIREALPYQIDYLYKPVEEPQLAITIEMAKARMQDYSTLANQVKELTDKLNSTNHEEGMAVTGRLRDLVEAIFCDVTFSRKALTKIVGIDSRVFRVIKAIDWKQPIN